MKKYLLLFILVILSSLNFAQSFDLQIIVMDSEKGVPISNANIYLDSSKYGTTSNSGLFTFHNINSGKYSVKISHISYDTFENVIAVISDTSLKILLSPASIKFNEIIVTSSKYEKNINSLPYSVASIKKETIQKNPSVTISDLLKNESGISLMRDGIWATEISIRGLNRTNIVTLIDGNRIEISTDISARLSMLNLNDIERIEVIKGAASSLYGSGATGGTVNIISKSGNYSDNLAFSGSYSGGYSSVNNFYSNGITLYASGNEWLTKISGNFRKAGNTKTAAAELSNSQFEDNNFSALFQVKPFENHEIKFNYQQFNAYDVGIPGASPIFPNNAIVTYPQELRKLLSAEYKLNNLSRSFVKLTAKYFYQFISRDVENIPGVVQYIPAANGQPPKLVSVLKICPGADHTIDGFQTQSDFMFTDQYLIAGIDYWTRNYNGLRSRDSKIEILNPVDSSVVKTMFKTIFEKPLPDADFSSAGIYVQDEIKLLNKLNVTLGGRYDFIWLNNSETINPIYEINDGILNNAPPDQKVIWNSESAENRSYVFNIGLLYLLSDNSNITFNAARSFRSPSLEERYQYIDLGSLVRVGNPKLKPEQGYFFDLGFRLFPEYLNFFASLFLNSLNNLVSEIPGTYDGRNALIKTNIGEALLYGFDYSIKYQLNNNIGFYNNLSFVRGQNRRDDSNLPQIAPLNGIFGIEYAPLAWLKSDFSTIIFTAQNYVAEGEKVTPSYVIFNFKIDFLNIEIENIVFNVTIGIENILNKEYRNHLSTNRGLVIGEPGRNFYIRTNIEL